MMIYRAHSNATPESLARDGQRIIGVQAIGDGQYIVQFADGAHLSAREENIAFETVPPPRDSFGRWVPSDSDDER